MKNIIFKKTKKRRDGVIITDFYGKPQVDCPICGETYPETSVRMHIYHTARAEVWNKELGVSKKAPHFNFYKKNTVGVLQHRIWRV